MMYKICCPKLIHDVREGASAAVAAVPIETLLLL